MGHEYFKRPVRTEGLLASTGTSTMSASDVAGGIGVEGPIRERVESITLGTTARTLSGHGVSFLTYASSGGARDAILPAPEFSGQTKEIFLIKETSSEEAQVHTPTTATVFAGTTFNQITVAASTTFTAGTPYLRLVAQSTATWAVSVGSTVDWDFAATTGSTAPA